MSPEDAEITATALGIRNPALKAGVILAFQDKEPGIHTPAAIRGLAEEMATIGRGGTPMEVANKLSLFTGFAVGALVSYAECLEAEGR